MKITCIKLYEDEQGSYWNFSKCQSWSNRSVTVGLTALMLIGRSSPSTDLNRPVFSDAVRNHEAVAQIKFLSVLGMFPLILSLNSFTSPFIFIKTSRSLIRIDRRGALFVIHEEIKKQSGNKKINWDSSWIRSPDKFHQNLLISWVIIKTILLRRSLIKSSRLKDYNEGHEDVWIEL